MSRRWFLMTTVISSLVIGMGSLFLTATPIYAQTSVPLDQEGCVGCHDNLYYLHDTGKWYCQCSASPDCSSCHGGNPTVLTEKEAHLGMIASPTRGEAETCQKCHPADYLARVGQFATAAGIKPTHPPCPTPTSAGAGIVVSGGAPPSLVAPKPANFWQIGGLILTTLAGLGFFAYFCRCLKHDQTTLP